MADEDPIYFEESDRISRGQAARILGCHPRTVQRLTEQGDLTRDPAKYYSREQVESLASMGPNNDEEDVVGRALKMALDHNERLMQLLEKPMKVATDTMVSLTERLTSRAQEQDEAYLESMKLIGELLLQKEERAAAQAASEMKADLLKKAGGQVIELLPQLLEQVGNGKAKAVRAFFSQLSDEEKTAIKSIGSAFEGEKKKLFEQMMEGM